jgi:prolipoprotein diacylglyceryltransferase
MHVFFLVLILCLVLFLYKLYHLAIDDYILMKKNVSVDQMFNCAILCSLVGLFFARLFYVFFHPSPIFLNPLGFLLFPYFPGLSVVGGLLGGGAALYLFSRQKKLPMGRVFDFFALAFTFVMPIGLIGFYLLSGHLGKGGIVEIILFSLILITSTVYLYPKATSLEIKQGSMSILFIIFFSLTLLLGNAIDNPGLLYFKTHPENFILLIMLAASVALILRQEITGRIK